ncbi:MAG: hypothetical protein K0R38_6654 [Polyangiaceae bacterium]|jgi:hypothetical protein|nr:hypothetical protein [Polyangiaceae bacterium]
MSRDTQNLSVRGALAMVIAAPPASCRARGFFEVQNPDALPGLFFLGRPLAEDTRGSELTLPSKAALSGFELALGARLDQDLGLLFAVARGCDSAPLHKVLFNNQSGGLEFYFVNNFPDPTVSSTTAQGAVGFVNVPIGTSILSAQFESGKSLRPTTIRTRPWMGDIYRELSLAGYCQKG